MSHYGAKTWLILSVRLDDFGQKVGLVVHRNMGLLGAICIGISVGVGGRGQS